MEHELTDTPAALPGITIGQSYAIQNNSRHVVYVATTTAAPTDAGAANRLHPAGSPLSVGRFRADTGESIWVWAAGLHVDGSIVYSEAL